MNDTTFTLSGTFISQQIQVGAVMPDGTIQWDHFLKTPEDRRQRQAEYTRSCERLGIIPPALSFVVRRVTTVAEGNVPVGDNEVFAD
jgi:hypothetical protein